MSFPGISDGTTVLYPFGADNRAENPLLKPATVVAETPLRGSAYI